MNEIRLVKGLDPLKVEVELEVEPPDSHPSGLTPLGDPGPFEPGGAEPPPSPEYRIEDRRVSQRYQANEGRCWIGWHDMGGFRRSAAWILNISGSGSLIATDAPTPTNCPVWLRLDDPAVPDWAEAKVVDVQMGQSGICAVRLVFRGVCPYAFIKAVAFAPRPGAARPGPSSSWNPNEW
jgi:hypothetical protein